MEILSRTLCNEERIEEQKACVLRHDTKLNENPTSIRLARSLKREKNKLKTMEKAKRILAKYPGLDGMALYAAFEFEKIPEGLVKNRLATRLIYSQRGDTWMGEPLPLGRVTIAMVRAERQRITAGLPNHPLPTKASVAARLERMEVARYPKTTKKTRITHKKAHRKTIT